MLLLHKKGVLYIAMANFSSHHSDISLGVPEWYHWTGYFDRRRVLHDVPIGGGGGSTTHISAPNLVRQEEEFAFPPLLPKGEGEGGKKVGERKVRPPSRVARARRVEEKKKSSSGQALPAH